MQNPSLHPVTATIKLAEILRTEVVKKFQATIAEKLKINLAIIDIQGRILSLYSKNYARAHNYFIKKTTQHIELDRVEEYTSIALTDKVHYLVFPLQYKRELKGHIIAGPVLKNKPLTMEFEELMNRYFLSKSELGDFLHTLPRLTAEELSMAVSFIDTLAEMVNQSTAEKIKSSASLQEVSALYKIMKSLNSTLSLKEVLTKVVQYSIDTVNGKSGSIMLIDEETGNLKIFVACGIDKRVIETTVIRPGEGNVGKVAETGVAQLVVKDRKKSGKKAQAAPGNPAVYVPLTVQGQIFGVLTIMGGRDSCNFTHNDLELLEVIASTAGVAINNAKLYEGLCKKVQEHATLLYVGNAISSSLNPDKVLQEVLDKAIKLLDAKKGSLMLIDDETKEMRIVNACGLSDDIIAHTRIKLGEGISGKVASEGEPLLFKKGIKVADSHREKNGKEMQSAISVPVKIKDKVIGVLNISEHLDGENFTADHAGLLQMLASQAAIAIENSRLHRELKELFVGSVKALINAIEARDPYTKGHSIRVTHYSSKIARALRMNDEEIENIQYAALLHDIGKINVKDEILLKPGKLSQEERMAIEEHPNYGALIMKPVKAFQRILPFLYYHHEKYAGSGYPTKLSGDSIPVESRIIAVADSFDAMTSDRPYRKALPIEDALKELETGSGVQFDPDIVKVFVKLVKTDKTCNPQYATDSPLF